MRTCGLRARPRLSAGQRNAQERQGLVDYGLLLGVVAVVMLAAPDFLWGKAPNGGGTDGPCEQ